MYTTPGPSLVKGVWAPSRSYSRTDREVTRSRVAKYQDHQMEAGVRLLSGSKDEMDEVDLVVSRYVCVLYSTSSIGSAD